MPPWALVACYECKRKLCVFQFPCSKQQSFKIPFEMKNEGNVGCADISFANSSIETVP
jgi:uncharacterized metal-binding protein